MRCQPGLYIYHLDEYNSIFAPKSLLDSSVYVHNHSPPPVAKFIGILLCNKPSIYTVAFRDGLISEYTDELLSIVPSTQSTWWQRYAVFVGYDKTKTTTWYTSSFI